MTSLERTTRAIEFRTPDRVPIWHEYLQTFAYEHLEVLRRIVTECPGDCGPHTEDDQVPDAVPTPDERRALRGRTCRDDWGCLWRYEEPGLQGIVVENPIRSYDQLKHYRIPDPNRTDWAALKARLGQRAHQRYVWTWPPNFFHLLTFLLGYEKLVVDLTLEEQGLIELMELILERHHLPCIRHLLECDCEALFFGDDLGTQQQLMVSPETWRRVLKPFYRRQFEMVKNAGKHVILHSDGYILDIIPDLIEIGVDALNPQHEIMPDEALVSRVRGRLCILTDLDRQRILPRGTPSQVREHVAAVRRKFHTPQGGIIYHGELAADVPLANVAAMYAAFAEMG